MLAMTIDRSRDYSRRDVRLRDRVQIHLRQFRCQIWRWQGLLGRTSAADIRCLAAGNGDSRRGTGCFFIIRDRYGRHEHPGGTPSDEGRGNRQREESWKTELCWTKEAPNVGQTMYGLL